MKRLATLAVLMGCTAFAPVEAQQPRHRAVPALQYVDGDSPDRTVDYRVVEEAQNYYPMKIGNTWTYNGPGMVKLVNKVVAHEKIDGVLCAKIETQVGGNVLAFEHIGVTADGIYRYSLNGVKVDKPVCILKLPAKPGTQWKVNAKVGAETITGQLKTTVEQVQVPAGTFRAVVASGKMEGGGQVIEAANYFVQGVGIAKIKMDVAGMSLVVELEKFEPGK
jgi:hypothetical protein